MRSNRNQRYDENAKNPIELIDAVGRHIQERAAGYQARLRKCIAKLYGITKTIERDFDLYRELIQTPCLAERKRIREATAENFKQYVHEAVVRRAFDGSDVSDSCVSKYIGVVRHCTQERVAPEKASAQIEDWGGLEAAYQRAKSTAKKDTSLSAKAGGAPKTKTSRAEQTVTASTKIFGHDHFHITLEKKALRSLLKARKGERRYINIECAGYDEAGYLIWELVEDDRGYSRGSPAYDNDDRDIGDAA